MVFYVKLLKALYSTLKAALIFYKKLVRDFEKKGFKVNPYDLCVANRMVNSKQQAIAWHVDDMKISHVDLKANDEFIEWLKTKYEDKEIGIMNANCGKVHNYLEMILNFTKKGKVKINIKD